MAWVYQPFLALLAVMLALSLAGLARPYIADARVRAAVAFVAAQPAIVYSFALQGSIKELATLWLIPLLAALVPVLTERQRPDGGPVPVRDLVRASAPLMLAAGAALAVIGPPAGIWLAPVLRGGRGAAVPPGRMEAWWPWRRASRRRWCWSPPRPWPP